ncbi:MAG: O-antigen ligase family protein [Firmicutes bacterium]|nr:O-antigen ligase family protein [Bacillota bacterium]
MLNTRQKLENFFLFYLLLNPFLDLVGGIYLRVSTLLAREPLYDMITPVLALRMMVLLLFAFYALRTMDKKIIFTILPIGVAWLLSLIGEFLFLEEFSLFADIQYIAKFVYNVAVLLVYWRFCQHSGLTPKQLLDKADWYVGVTLLILAGSILLSYVFGLGYATYGDRFGVSGSRGFFYSGNDITAVLMLLLPLALTAYLRLEGKPAAKIRLFWLLPPAVTIAALLIISTKTSFIAVGIVLLTFFFYTWFQGRKAKDYRLLRRFGMVVLTFAGIFILISLASQAALFFDIGFSLGKLRRIQESTGLDGLLFSGRQDILHDVVDQFKEGGPFAWLFGIGRGGQKKLIEMDLFEVVFYYGLTGAVTMLWTYLRVGVDFLKAFFRSAGDIVGVACFVSLGSTVAYLIIAGHVLFSVTSGFYFALVLLYARLHYQGLEDWHFWKRKSRSAALS